MAEPLALPRRFTESEAAATLGISVHALRRLERNGHIRAFRPTPRRVYYTEIAIRDFMEMPKPWDRKTSESASTSSVFDRTAQSIAHAGTTTLPDRQSALLSAQQTFQKRR